MESICLLNFGVKSSEVNFPVHILKIYEKGRFMCFSNLYTFVLFPLLLNVYIRKIQLSSQINK